MMPPRLYPALEIAWPSPADDEALDCMLAAVDGAAPTAAEPFPGGLRIFFATPDARERAAADARAFEPSATVRLVDVPDEFWAERSQASLSPIRVGCLTIAPPWIPRAEDLGWNPAGTEPTGAAAAASSARSGESHWITIQPSMGFGTGHHSTTRLCLGLLQTLPVAGRSVADVGTGSGVLALAAARLGAAPIVAIDGDPDALTAARENVERNLADQTITLRLAELAPDGMLPGGPYDVLLANLTGATLERLAGPLASATRPGGVLVVSGLQIVERDEVVAAFAAAGVALEREVAEDDWLALLLRRR